MNYTYCNGDAILTKYTKQERENRKERKKKQNEIQIA